MNDNNGEGSSCCFFHPREAAVGICALCLKERLIILAAKQGHVSPKNQNNQKSFIILRRKPSINLSKVFALGSFLHLLQFKSQRPPWDSYEDHVGSDESSIASPEDSFISIKFTDKGQAFWDCKKSGSMDNTSTTNKQTFIEEEALKSVVKHAKTRARLRWRTRIGNLFHVAPWKRSSKAGACHVGMSTKMDGPRARRSWIRNFNNTRQEDN